MRGELAHEGMVADAVYCCPYHPEHGVGEYKLEHEDRKPGPGILRRRAREFGVELSESVMVGDRCSDVEVGNAAGVRQMFLLRGTEEGCGGKFIAVDSLAQVERSRRGRGSRGRSSRESRASGVGHSAEIDGDVLDMTGEAADELALGPAELIVEAAQDAAGGEGLVVLGEVGGQTGGREGLLVEGLGEPAAFVAEAAGLKELDVTQRAG